MCLVIQTIKFSKFLFCIQPCQMFIMLLTWAQQCARIMHTQLFPGPEKFTVYFLVYSFVFVSQSQSTNIERQTATLPDELFSCWRRITYWSFIFDYFGDYSGENGVASRKHLLLYLRIHFKTGIILNPFQWRALYFAELLDVKPWVSQ